MPKTRRSNLKPRPLVELVAVWGNGDADSTIKISRRQWKRIQGGESFEKSTWGFYEGTRFYVRWRFRSGRFSVFGNDGEHILDEPIEDLIVNEPRAEGGEVGA